MCRFMSLDLEYSLKCPFDQKTHTVRFQAYPQLRGHTLDVVACSAVSQIDEPTCGKTCRGLLESGGYWQRVYADSAVYSQSQ
jgi:hypothetical protein